MIQVFYVGLYFLFDVYFKDLGQNGLEHPAVDISLEDSSGMLVDGFERTYDGKLKCRYCNYATRGTARLIEHIRIHTGKNFFSPNLYYFFFLRCLCILVSRFISFVLEDRFAIVMKNMVCKCL